MGVRVGRREGEKAKPEKEMSKKKAGEGRGRERRTDGEEKHPALTSPTSE